MAQQSNFDIQSFQKGMSTYLNTLKSVISGITASASGTAAGISSGAGAAAGGAAAAAGGAAAALPGVGLVLAFFQVMIGGILEAEMAKKYYNRMIVFRGQQIEQLFVINQEKEAAAREMITAKLKSDKDQAENEINQAKYIHIIIALIVAVVVAFLLFFIFPKRK
jgi:hypothetical protein